MSEFVTFPIRLSEISLDIRSLHKITGDGFNKELKSVNGRFSDITAYGGYLLIEGSCHNFNFGPSVSEHFKEAEIIALLLVTLGVEYQYVEKEFKSDSLLRYMCDIIASEYTELCADYINSIVSKVAVSKSLFFSNRYSPGYCGWPTEEQKKLFSYLPEKPLGITLNNRMLMSPIKSVSAVIAMGVNVTYKKYDCSGCSIINCNHKKYYYENNS